MFILGVCLKVFQLDGLPRIKARRLRKIVPILICYKSQRRSILAIYRKVAIIMRMPEHPAGYFGRFKTWLI